MKERRCIKNCLLIYINWGIITLQYCDGFFHTSAWISHRHTFLFGANLSQYCVWPGSCGSYYDCKLLLAITVRETLKKFIVCKYWKLLIYGIPGATLWGWRETETETRGPRFWFYWGSRGRDLEFQGLTLSQWIWNIKAGILNCGKRGEKAVQWLVIRN